MDADRSQPLLILFPALELKKIFSSDKLLENSVGYPSMKKLAGIDKNCHEKACHCVGGEYFFFGNEKSIGTQNELEFGQFYR